MEKLTVLPANPESFKRLLKFAKKVLEICERHSVSPIVYGGLAYFAHTRDQSLPVQDLDLLVPEEAFSDLVLELKNIDGVTFVQQPWHSIEVSKGDLKIDFDSAEHFLHPRSHGVVIVDVQGAVFSILNKDALASIYQEALDNMPNDKELDEKRAKYLKKLNNLKSIT